MTKRTIDDLRDEMIAVARGQRSPSPRPAAPLASALSESSLAVMEALIRETPESVSALAAALGRAQPNLSRSLQQLQALGLVRMVREGKSVRPVPTARRLVLDFETGTYHAADAA